jgi:hypothetical protein
MPSLAPNTGSITQISDAQRPGGHDATFVQLSTNIVIRVNAIAIGAIQEIQYTESRNITMVDEVGTDGHIDSAPTKSTDVTGSCQRLRFSRARLTEAFGRGYLHLHSQRIPFDIDIYDIANGDGSNAIVTTLKNVWFNNLAMTMQASNWLITETAQFMAEEIYSNLNGGNAATGGLLGSNIMQINSIERQADMGKRLGSMDAPGLITDFFSNV